MGGAFYGRGYREVYYFVDRYAIVSGQWQCPAFFIPAQFKLPYASKPLKETTQLVSFVDYGYGEIAAPSSGVKSTFNVFSSGLGLRTQLNNRISGRFDVGFPFVRQKPYSQKPRLHFGLDIALR